MKLIKTVTCCLLASFLLGGCSVFKFPSVYTINVQQGNIVTQEMIDQLKPGMTKRQVNYVMGTPLVADTFNQDRWDYFFSIKSGATGKVIRKQFTIYFADDKLSHFEGDYRPGDNSDVNLDTVDEQDTADEEVQPENS